MLSARTVLSLVPQEDLYVEDFQFPPGRLAGAVYLCILSWYLRARCLICVLLLLACFFCLPFPFPDFSSTLVMYSLFTWSPLNLTGSHIADAITVTDVMRQANVKLIRDRLRAHSVVLTRFRTGSPGWVFRRNVADLAVLSAAWQRWRRHQESVATYHPQLLQAFGVFDAEGRGFIVATDLQRVMGSMGSGAKLEAFEAMVRLGDRTDSSHQDGQLSAVDFCYMMAPDI